MARPGLDARRPRFDLLAAPDCGSEYGRIDISLVRVASGDVTFDAPSARRGLRPLLVHGTSARLPLVRVRGKLVSVVAVDRAGNVGRQASVRVRR